ncbi:uncharacterized protein BXZ73DRAFT_103809 [Epithele typhae]|uniref:uncharacterized protein n=1 Tax=Epithele typhae TaxID=378194 RepID=UPI0020081E7C|nr:uncharacterized protein BXZ73DRAFT_103809 [Epithele typhae]KAH9923764.1 hypothetical protein BXZ73DRAFT_103809 [Epithele typhae]
MAGHFEYIDAFKTTFPSPFKFRTTTPITLVELRIRFFSGSIRSKANWWEKVHDSDIVSSWREEILAHDRTEVDRWWGGDKYYDAWMPPTSPWGRPSEIKAWPRDVLTSAQLDYTFDQLLYEASQVDKRTGTFATAIQGVYESRTLIPAALGDALVNAVKTLESVPEAEKDWHPGSNRQVLDLVHPSLYCLRIGDSCSFADGRIEAMPQTITMDAYRSARPDLRQYTYDHLQYAVSPRYQWLPTDFTVSQHGAVRPMSYINNIDPARYPALYPTLASILEKFVPLFEHVLTTTNSSQPPLPLAIAVDPVNWYPERPDWAEPLVGETQEELRARQEEWTRLHEWPIIPDPAPFSPPPARAPYSLRGRTIQVIVKLANIVLTPDHPRYPGGAWHVEGMANERIVATGLLYYAAENITPSRLAFRALAGDHEGGIYMDYEQSDYTGWRVAFGLDCQEPLNQPLGSVLVAGDGVGDGRCVAFPNVYQHCVEPFELADPTRGGHRKIVAFFLVNPETRIASTTEVLPQQEGWVRGSVEAMREMDRLPTELYDIVMKEALVGVVSRERAEADREALMEERSRFVVKHNEEVFEVPFNMCEH